MFAERFSPRQFVFDTAIWIYTFAMIAYLAAWISFPESAQLDQDFFLAYFETVVWLCLGTFVASLLISAFVQMKSGKSIGAALFSHAGRMPTAKPFWQTAWGIHALSLFAVTTLVSIQITQSSLTELLDRDGLEGAWRLWSGFAQPNFSILPKAILEVIETVYIAFLATILAVPAAFLLAFFCAKNIMTGPVPLGIYLILRTILNVSRSVEPLVWALIFTVWVGVGPFAGMLALFVHSVASLAKYYSEILENVEEGPLDGVRATGANKVQVIWYAVVPQVVLPYIAMTIYRWDTNVRMATVIGLVGGGGIGTLLIQYQGQAMWPEVGCIILVIAAIVWLMDLLSAYVREALK